MRRLHSYKMCTVKAYELLKDIEIHNDSILWAFGKLYTWNYRIMMRLCIIQYSWFLAYIWQFALSIAIDVIYRFYQHELISAGFGISFMKFHWKESVGFFFKYHTEWETERIDGIFQLKAIMRASYRNSIWWNNKCVYGKRSFKR